MNSCVSSSPYLVHLQLRHWLGFSAPSPKFPVTLLVTIQAKYIFSPPVSPLTECLRSHDTTKCFKKSTRPLGGDNWYATYQNKKKTTFWVHIVSFFQNKSQKTKCVNKKWSLDAGSQWGWDAVECHVTNTANKGQNELRCHCLSQLLSMCNQINSHRSFKNLNFGTKPHETQFGPCKIEWKNLCTCVTYCSWSPDSHIAVLQGWFCRKRFILSS